MEGLFGLVDPEERPESELKKRPPPPPPKPKIKLVNPGSKRLVDH